MARMHGRDVRVWLGSRQASSDFISLGLALTAETHDVTVFGNSSGESGWKQFGPGIAGWELTFDAFYQPQAGGIGQQLEGMLGTTGGVMTILGGNGDTVGDPAVALLTDAVLAERSQPQPVADMIKLSGTFRPAIGTDTATRPALNGVLTGTFAEQSNIFSFQAVDGGAASAAGGRMNVHVATAMTGSWNLITQHSVDSAVWTDYLTASSVAGGGISIMSTVAVNRYIRFHGGINGSTVGASVTPLAAFARF